MHEVSKKIGQDIIHTSQVILSVLLKDAKKIDKNYSYEKHKDYDSNAAEIKITIYNMQQSLWDLKHELEKLQHFF